MPDHSYRFPKGFTWGVAAAATQIEGAATTAGKGESIWDRFSSTKGNVVNGDTPAIACDHYRRFKGDFALMRRLGLRNNRLSIAWPRIIPDGTGAVNQRGLDFYSRLFDSMEANGITPWVTLFHWDLPQSLEDVGGWRVRSTSEAFARYADVVVSRFGSRVKHWFTLNEIPCFIGHGYKLGSHAPGAREPDGVVNKAYHNALLAHGHAVRAVREHGGRGAQCGLVHNPPVGIPVIETPEGILAAREWTERENWHLLAPLFKGRYPNAYLRACGTDAPRVEKGDMALISSPTDFLGLNIYSGAYVQADKKGRPEVLPTPDRFPRADLPWLEHTPQAIYWALRHLHELYGMDRLLIAENGAGYEEAPASNGEINDLHRREYLRNYLIAVQRAVSEGIPVSGYFLWSFIDNFEWAYGYAKRFGIVHNDFCTQKRTPKLSARWYSQVIKENRVL